MTVNRIRKLVPLLLVVIGLLAFSSVAQAQTATRSLPDTYTPTQAVSVSIQVNPVAGTQAWAVEETPPNAWTVSDISEDGVWDSVNKKVKWGPFFSESAKSLTYKAAPPAGESGTKTFSGVSSVDGTSVDIAGDLSIEKEPEGAETVSTPGTPTGESSPCLDQSYTYTTAGAISSLGHTVEYQFNWGDESASSWSTSKSASHSWSSTGQKTVTVTARCQTHTSISAMSDGKTVIVQDCSGTPILYVNTEWVPVDAEAPLSGGSYIFQIQNNGDGMMAWAIAETCNWVSVSPTSGTNNATITVSISANSTGSYRICEMTIRTSGAEVTVMADQAGEGGADLQPELSVAPSSRSVGSGSGSRTFNVSNSGTGTLSWSATDNASWVTLSNASGTNSGTITANYQANSGTSSRSCTITISASGATGSPKTVTVNQAGIDPQPEISVSPGSRSVDSGSGSTTFDVSNSGTGTLSWSATDDASWVTLSNADGTNSGTITANYQANSSTSSRSCTITITASGANGSPNSVTVNQAGIMTGCTQSKADLIEGVRNALGDVFLIGIALMTLVALGSSQRRM